MCGICFKIVWGGGEIEKSTDTTRLAVRGQLLKLDRCIPPLTYISSMPLFQYSIFIYI